MVHLVSPPLLHLAVSFPEREKEHPWLMFTPLPRGTRGAGPMALRMLLQQLHLREKLAPLGKVLVKAPTTSSGFDHELPELRHLWSTGCGFLPLRCGTVSGLFSLEVT